MSDEANGSPTRESTRPGNAFTPQTNERLPSGGGLRMVLPMSFPWWSLPLWLLTLTSLALNVIILRELVTIRQIARASVTETIEVVNSFQEETFAYTFTVEDVIDVNTDIPFEETIDVPIRDSIAINTSVQVPVNAGPLGSFNVTIPISTVIPIELDVPVEIDRTINVRAAVPIEVDVPVSIAIEETPLSNTLADLEAGLIDLEEELSQPIILGLGGADE